MLTPLQRRLDSRRGRTLTAFFALVGTLTWAAAPALADTQTFLHTGAEQTFTVPGGVSTVHVVAIGGRGGGSANAVVRGGEAHQVTGDLGVTAGQTLYLEVGGSGQNASDGGAGGFNGGGAGATGSSGGGGGASDVRAFPRAAGLGVDSRPRFFCSRGHKRRYGALPEKQASADRRRAAAPIALNHTNVSQHVWFAGNSPANHTNVWPSPR